MKIILLGGVLSFGGMEQHMLTLAQAQALRQRRYDTETIARQFLQVYEEAA